MTDKLYLTDGKTTVAPDVLLTIARLTTLGVNGVSHLSMVPSNAVRLFKRGHVGEGVIIEIEAASVQADIYVVLKPDLNIQDIGRKIQVEVARAITEMVGMPVTAVNIHVEDIKYPTTSEV